MVEVFNKEKLCEEAWSVLDACTSPHGGILAAAHSDLYPHLWTRDACICALGILSAARGDKDLQLVTKSLAHIARHQCELGRMPLKVDLQEDKPVAENSAGVDGGLWFVIAVDALSQAGGPTLAEPFLQASFRALRWSMHLDVNGCGLLESPEASDWADMLPHRHNVLGTNILFRAALRAGGRLALLDDQHEFSAQLDARAKRVGTLINLLFWPEDCYDADGTARWLKSLEAEYPEWSRTGVYLAPLGALPFYLPYVGFRAAGQHCDVTGNLLSIITGAAPGARAKKILTYLQDSGCASPFATRAIYPPIFPGDSDWRTYFHWRNLNLPHHYQNGGAWPFIGGFHVAALTRVGAHAEANALLGNLSLACQEHGEWTFPEWRHGQTGVAMGERKQAWSAANLLFALECVVQEHVPFFHERAAEI